MTILVNEKCQTVCVSHELEYSILYSVEKDTVKRRTRLKRMFQRHVSLVEPSIIA